MLDTKKNGLAAQGSGSPLEFTYNSSDKKVRSLIIDNQPWFIAKDVCQALDLSDTEVAIRKLDEDEKLVRKVYASGQNRNVILINESGLYNLIFRSNKAEAKLFRKWVTNEVLPALRRNGSYAMKPVKHSYGSPQLGGFVDLRDQAYDSVEVCGKWVRHFVWEDADWYSLLDTHKALGSTTSSKQCARMLNSKRELARKFWIYGATNPGWFVKGTGLSLLLSGSRVLKAQGLRLVLPFPQALKVKGGAV